MPFYIYAWIGAMTSGLNVVTAKLTSRHAISNPWFFNFLLALVTLIFTIPVALIFHAGIPNNWLPIILAAVFSTLFYTTWIFAIRFITPPRCNKSYCDSIHTYFPTY